MSLPAFVSNEQLEHSKRLRRSINDALDECVERINNAYALMGKELIPGQVLI